MASPYPERLQDTLQEWIIHLSGRVTLDYLAFLLSWEPPQATAGSDLRPHEKVKCTAWLTLLEHSGKGPQAAALDNYLVGGLLENDRWRTLLSSEKEANLLARLAVRLHSHSSNYNAADAADADMRHNAQIDLRKILKGWFAPAELPEVLTSTDLAIFLFGEAWTSLVYEDHPASDDLANVLEYEQPDLMPGRLTIDVPRLLEELPSLASAP